MAEQLQIMESGWTMLVVSSRMRKAHQELHGGIKKFVLKRKGLLRQSETDRTKDRSTGRCSTRWK